ncbi:MAG: glutamine-hydrolyzing GMP synthase [Candidatus Diapherotrites archaeon]|nr:glutamine-hydrolyzing GMP synthase [Candidatus Diapherotrites archaeon]
MSLNKIAVIDFGGQYAHLIARRIRELGVYSEILLPEETLEKFKKFKGIILSGSPFSVKNPKAPKISKQIFELSIPILGLCYGHQLIAELMGGKVGNAESKEYGKAELEIIEKTKLLDGLEKKEIVWMSHGDSVIELPANFKEIARTHTLRNAGIMHQQKQIYGLQFHAEVKHTVHGMKILENFLFKICKTEKDWNSKHFLENKIKEIQQQTENKKVLVLASGGVDSTVCLALLAKALPSEQIIGLHIDTGFMRFNESKEVKKALNKVGYWNLKVIDGKYEFFFPLQRIIDPEEKRKMIGKKFVEIKQREIKKLGLNENEWLLCQGTIYPDTIESAGTKHSDKIKTHHNRVQEILDLIQQGKVIEPIQELYKDEVRKLGIELGLPKELVQRHPFPGPGLAIRIVCSAGKPEQELELLETKVNQVIRGTEYTAKILPIKSVGVQGDERSYQHAAILCGKLNWNELEKLSILITNQVKEINRVLYCVWPENLTSLKVKKARLDKKRIEHARKLDQTVNEQMKKHNLLEKIWQFPTVLIPVQVNYKLNESVVLRPVESTEAMTANFYKMKKKILEELVEKLRKQKISGVLYDITNKPPATIEWE